MQLHEFLAKSDDLILSLPHIWWICSPGLIGKVDSSNQAVLTPIVRLINIPPCLKDTLRGYPLWYSVFRLTVIG